MTSKSSSKKISADIKMPGYVRNTGSLGCHIMKRYVEPNGKIDLEELYLQYGKKYNLERGEQFIKWLSDVKLKDKDRWEINQKPSKKDFKKIAEAEEDRNIIPSKLTVMEIVDLSVRKAREVVPRIGDVKLLKYALSEASQRAQKSEVCKLLRKRISELEALGVR